MTTAVNGNFPLQYSLDTAESVGRFLRRQPSGDLGPRVWESLVSVALEFPARLRQGWRVAYDGLKGPPGGDFIPVREVEEVREAVQKAFSGAGEALEKLHAEAIRRGGTSGDDAAKLAAALEEVRRLEHGIFKDWVSFREPLPDDPGEALPVDESLAEILGVTVEQARRKLEERRRQLGW